METKSQALLKAAKEEGLVVRLLKPNEGESKRLLALLDALYFSDGHPFELNRSEYKWADYTEQTACLRKLIPYLMRPLETNGGRFFFVPIFGPDEILEISIASLLRLMDLFLDLDWFVICRDDAVPAIIQRRHGVMELFMANSG